MRIDLITIFPEFFGTAPTADADGSGILGHGVTSRAFRESIANVHVHDLRSFTHDRHRTVDDRPFGGGEGMVLKPGPIAEALRSTGITAKPARDTTRERVILLSAQGKRFTQATARELSRLDRLVLLCGRYEGVDERVSQLFCDDELSIGDYVLSGGELAAAVLLDAVVRLLPGVLGHADSSRYESFGEGEPFDAPADAKTDDGVPRATASAGGILDYPHYTRPADFEGLAVPDVLLGGDHTAIRRWRRRAALAKTLANRPDLLLTADLSSDDRKDLADLG